MSLKEQIESGKVFTEYGHTAQEDQEYEKIIEAQRRKSKQLCFRYNQTDPMDEEGREKLVRELLGGTGKTLWLEAPIHFAYGCHTTVGDHFYSNFNLTVVDDGRVSIGKNSVIGAGSVVTRDIPENVVAFGTPCRVIRPITDADLETIRPGMTINVDWNA
mgnify:CR=1 FL=1